MQITARQGAHCDGEGGVAAALANVDDRDNWRVHFADTMRGGQYLNNWRMAELHAKEAPDRVRELEAWGAVFDRTPDGRILQRNFGGHKYPRLAHVGDRTGLEMIRTLQDYAVQMGIDVHMECTVVEIIKDGDRIAGAFAYDRDRGRFKVFESRAIVLATGGIGRAFSARAPPGIHRRRPSLAYRAGAALRTLISSGSSNGMCGPRCPRILVTAGVAAKSEFSSSRSRRLWFDDTLRLPQPDRAMNGSWRYVQGDKNRGVPRVLTRTT